MGEAAPPVQRWGANRPGYALERPQIGLRGHLAVVVGSSWLSEVFLFLKGGEGMFGGVQVSIPDEVIQP